MALTSEQRTKIRHYLGYPQVYLYANTRLESAIDRVALDADASALAIDLLTQLATVEASYLEGVNSAGVRTLDKDDVGFFQGNEGIQGKARIGRALCNRLSILFGVGLANDVFGVAGYQSDTWMLNNGRVSIAGLG